MRHGKSLRKLSRSSSHRRALFRNQVTSLIEHERIETTEAKAKELRRVADKVVTWGKKNTLRSRRKIQGFVQTHESQRKLLREIAPRFATREGGYTRVLKTRYRRGDCAPMAVVEFSETDRSILSSEQRRMKEMRKSKYARMASAPSLANVLDSAGGAGDGVLSPLDPSGKL